MGSWILHIMSLKVTITPVSVIFAYLKLDETLGITIVSHRLIYNLNPGKGWWVNWIPEQWEIA